MTGPGLEDWERQIIDSAKLFRSAAPTTINRAFEELVRALWVLDAQPEHVATALDQLHAEIVTAVDQARADARRRAEDEFPKQIANRREAVR